MILHSKAHAYTYTHLFYILYTNATYMSFCFRFYTQMRVEKKTKHLHIEFIVTSYNSVVELMAAFIMYESNQGGPDYQDS